MATSKFASRLDGMNQQYSESKNQADSMFGGVKVPEWTYIARLQKAVIKESQSSGKLMIRREHIIVEGEFLGMVIYDNMQLETPMGFAFVRRWLDLLEYQAPEKPSDLEDILEAMTDEAPTCKIQVKHSGDFINVSVVELLKDYAGTGTAKSETKAEKKEEKTEEKKEEKKETPRSSVKREKVTKEEPKEEEKENDDSAMIARLQKFCKTQDVDFSKEDDLETICQNIRQWKWPKSQMTEEEIALFEEVGLSDSFKEEKATSKKK